MASREPSNLLDQAIKSGDIERIKRLVSVKIADNSNLTRGIFLAMNSTHSTRLQNEIIKVLLAHPEMEVSINNDFLTLKWTSLPTILNMCPDQPSDSLEDKVGPTLLKTWIEEGNLDLVKALVKHPKIDAKDVSEGISIAIKSDLLREPSNEKLQIDIIKTLLDRPDIDVNSDSESNGFSALHVAVVMEQLKTVETLIKHPRIDVNRCAKVPDRENHKTTPLNMSISLNKSTDITKVLLEHPNIDVNKTDSETWLPLSLRVKNEKALACFEMLLNHQDIDVNAQDGFLKHTPLMCRILSKEFEAHGKQFYQEKAIQLLLKHNKIDLELKDDEGQNVLHHMILAIMFEETEDETISDHKARFGNWYDLISDVLENNPNLNRPDKDKDTPIDIALEQLRDPANLMKAIVTKHFQKVAQQIAEDYLKIVKDNADDLKPNAKNKAEEDLQSKADEESAQNTMKSRWNCEDCDACKAASPEEKERARKFNERMQNSSIQCPPNPTSEQLSAFMQAKGAESMKLFFKVSGMKKEYAGEHKCSLLSCEKPGAHRCSRCKSVFYCSKECADKNWPRHRPNCKEQKCKSKEQSKPQK